MDVPLYTSKGWNIQKFQLWIWNFVIKVLIDILHQISDSGEPAWHPRLRWGLDQNHHHQIDTGEYLISLSFFSQWVKEFSYDTIWQWYPDFLFSLWKDNAYLVCITYMSTVHVESLMYFIICITYIYILIASSVVLIFAGVPLLVRR